MPLLLIRHGETALNVARTLQPIDTPLGPRGLAQVEALARRLAAMDVAGILSSDMPRALQTAQAIEATTGRTIQTTPLLQERNFGDLRGRPYDTLGFDPLTMVEAPPNGESLADFGQRAEAAFAAALKLQATLTSGSLAIVSHGLLIRQLLMRCVTLGAGMTIPTSIANASLTVIAVGAPHEVLLLDSTSHLGDTVRDDPRNLSGG
jgi:probable phosphoglycerate mutase